VRRIVFGVALTLFAVFAPLATGVQGRIDAFSGRSASPNLLYIAAGHLWLRPVDGGAARLIATPWPTTTKDPNVFSSFQWSPDGRRVAIDDSRQRLAVINLATRHITVLLGNRCSGDCYGPVYTWSPSGRYLAVVQPVGNGERATLRVWDSQTGRSRQLLTGLATYAAYPEWSHDSTRIAVEVGAFDVSKNAFPGAVTVDLAGHVVQLGKGLNISWSPDDRLVGIIRPNFCGANTCDEDVLVRSSAGGTPIVLARHSSSLFDTPIWAPQAGGYAFDRWILNASGHPIRRLAGPHERVLSWRTDGSRLALQTYYPYQGTPDVLYLSTPIGKRVHLYTDGWNSGCGACSKDVYGVTWGRRDLVAFSTPTYPTPKDVTVYPRFFLSSSAGGPLTRIGISRSEVVTILGFVDGDRELVIHAGRAVYRYSVATHRLTAIVTGVPEGYSTAVLDPRVVGIVSRRAG